MARVLAVAALWAIVVLAHEPSAAQSQAVRPEPIQSGFGAGAYPLGSVFPSVDKVVKPNYPEAAVRAGIEGEVLLEAVVGPNGSVADARVVKSLDTSTGLDDAALDAVRKWKFKPATIEGRKVAAVVALRVAFYLRQPGKTSGKPFVETGLRSPDDSAFENATAADAPGVTRPTLVRDVRPRYTSEAMRRKIQGRVVIEAVIGIEGRVTAARITRSLDSSFGLDRQALAAARQWEFTPARRDGVPIPVKIQIDLEFRLH